MKQALLTPTLALALLAMAPLALAGDASSPKAPAPDPKEIAVQRSQAEADPYAFHDGFYVTAAGGLNVREQATENATTYTQFDPGYIVGGGVGYRYSSFRFELEGNYLDNSNSRLSAPGVGEYSAVGHVTLYDAFFNAYYDYRIGKSRWVPFVGAGVGALYSRINGLWFGSGPAAGFPNRLNGTSGAALAWNVQAGVSYLLTPHIDLFVEYRYQDTGDLHFKFNNAAVPNADPDGALTHNAEVGLRYHFF